MQLQRARREKPLILLSTLPLNPPEKSFFILFLFFRWSPFNRKSSKPGPPKRPVRFHGNVDGRVSLGDLQSLPPVHHRQGRIRIRVSSCLLFCLEGCGCGYIHQGASLGNILLRPHPYVFLCKKTWTPQCLGGPVFHFQSDTSSVAHRVRRNHTNKCPSGATLKALSFATDASGLFWQLLEGNAQRITTPI